MSEDREHLRDLKLQISNNDDPAVVFHMRQRLFEIEGLGRRLTAQEVRHACLQVYRQHAEELDQ